MSENGDNNRVLMEHLLASLDQFHEVARSSGRSLAELSARVGALEALLQRINATLHEGANGQAPIIARLALLERPVPEMDDEEAKVEEAKGKWKAVATGLPGVLALLGLIVKSLLGS